MGNVRNVQPQPPMASKEIPNGAPGPPAAAGGGPGEHTYITNKHLRRSSSEIYLSRPPKPPKKHKSSIDLSQQAYDDDLLAPASSPPDILPPSSLSESEQSSAYLNSVMKDIFDNIPQHFIGGLSDTKQNLPTCPKGPADDGRKLTWHKLLFSDLKTKILNQSYPTCHEDCWMVPMAGSDSSGYIIKKFASRGEGNKHQLHKVLYHLLNGTDTSDIPSGHEYAHRCGRGRYDRNKGIIWACINPRHITIVSHSLNLDHDFCRRGMALLCPHTPKCIYTDKDGKSLPCRNALDKTSLECDCGRGDCLDNHWDIPS